MKGCAKRITDDLKDEALIFLDRLPQDLIVTRKQGWHRIWMFLGEFCASFDVRKEKSNRARG